MEAGNNLENSDKNKELKENSNRQSLSERERERESNSARSQWNLNLENKISNLSLFKILTIIIAILILFLLNSLGVFTLLIYSDNIIYWGNKEQYVCKYDCGFGLLAIFFAPIVSCFVFLYVFILFMREKNIYIFALIVPIFTLIIMKITGHKIISYFNISEYIGVAEIIDISIAILLYVITKFLIEKFILKDNK